MSGTFSGGGSQKRTPHDVHDASLAMSSKAEERFRLSQKAYLGGQIEYLRVLQSQRAEADARRMLEDQ